MIARSTFRGAARLLAVAAVVAATQVGSARAQQFGIGTFGQSGTGTTFAFNGASFASSTMGVFILSAPNTIGAPAVTAFLSLTGTTGATTTTGTSFRTAVTGASFTITSMAGGAGVNYLSGTFNGAIQGDIGGTAASILAEIPPDSLTYSSSIFTVPLLPPASLAFGLSGITPTLTVTGGALAPFAAQVAGRFSATVPEPATVALLGLGLAGVPVASALRRRRATPQMA